MRSPFFLYGLSLAALASTIGCGTSAVTTGPAAATTAGEAAHGESNGAADPEAPADLKEPPADAERSATGLVSRQLEPGFGKEKPTADDTVIVHYVGWTSDGVKFDSSVDRGKPVAIPMSAGIKGWTEGLQLMVEGEQRRLWIPSALAYGDKPPAGAPAGALIFNVQLLSIRKPAQALETPKDVAAVPGDAQRTRSGLAYRVLTEGTGTARPTATSVVEVHYSGWTIDGTLFDSSVKRGRPARFSLDGVIPGWTEGVQLMTVGQKTRFWIPGRLAYGDKPSSPDVPAGMLVFDIELLSIK